MFKTMTEVLKKYKCIVFGPRQKDGKCPISDLDVKSTFQRHRRKNVTFADIEELHRKYGGSTRTEEVNKDTNGPRTISKIGYINRNCAEYVNKHDVITDKQTEVSDHGHINFAYENHDPATKRKDVVREPFEVTFGKKGKLVGEFQDATCITHVSRGHVLITDMINGRIQRCTREGEASAAYGGDLICEPWSTCITHDEHIAVTSRRRRIVLIVSKEGDVHWSFGAGFFHSPSGICMDSEGNFIVTDSYTNQVSVHDKDGHFVRYVGNAKNKEETFANPRYVCVSMLRGDIIVSDSGHHCIKIFDKRGHFIRSIGRFGKGCGQLKSPYGICTDRLGHILVADHYNNRVSMFSADGDFLCHVVDETHGIVHPKGLALSPDLNLYVSTGHLKACNIKVFKLKSPDPTQVVAV